MTQTVECCSMDLGHSGLVTSLRSAVWCHAVVVDPACLAFGVPLFIGKQHEHTNMHTMTSSTRIAPPTPPPIAAATEDEIEVESIYVKRNVSYLRCFIHLDDILCMLL